MKTKILYSIVLVVATIFASQAQSVLGKWKTIDDETKKPKSIVEIYEDNGKVFGKVIEILDKTKEGKLCEECTGAQKNKPIKGLIIVQNLKKNGSSWDGGTILDPSTGKEYKCSLTLESSNKLKVRGYLGISLLGRTQYWERVK